MRSINRGELRRGLCWSHNITKLRIGLMPIAKLVSADGPIDIYYELQGRDTTNRDDFSYSEAKNGCKIYDRESSSLNSTAETDPELGRVKSAIDSAAASDRKADKGKQMLASQQSKRNVSEATKAEPGSIELTDMSGKARPYQNGVSEPASRLTNDAKHACNGASPDRADMSKGTSDEPEQALPTANGVRDGEHVIEMPHEDTTHAISG